MDLQPFHRGADELNIASLSLISIQSRLPADFLEWEDSFEIDGRPVVVKAQAGSSHGLPHGIDVDTNAALINLFLEQGCPSDNSVRVTMYELLRSMRFSDGGENYQRVNESLQRMYRAAYHIQGWFDIEGGMVIGFTMQLITKIMFERRGEQALLGKPFGRNTALRITFPEEIANNIRNGHLRAIDLDFMSGLGAPLTRGLFRMLDARSDGGPVFSIGLMEWAKRCRLSTSMPNKIKRMLQPAHDELVAKGFLKQVCYEGRTDKQTVRYEFARQRPDLPMSDAQLSLLGRIKMFGVAGPQAEGFVRGNQEGHVAARVVLAEEILKRSRAVKNPGALCWDVLQDRNGKYLAADAPAPIRVLNTEKVSRATGAKARGRQGDGDPEKESWTEAEYDAAAPAANARQTLRALKMLLREQATEAMYRQIEAAVISGRMNGRDVVVEASKASAELKLQSFLDDLRLMLGREIAA